MKTPACSEQGQLCVPNSVWGQDLPVTPLPITFELMPPGPPRALPSHATWTSESTALPWHLGLQEPSPPMAPGPQRARPSHATSSGHSYNKAGHETWTQERYPRCCCSSQHITVGSAPRSQLGNWEETIHKVGAVLCTNASVCVVFSVSPKPQKCHGSESLLKYASLLGKVGLVASIALEAQF